MEKIEKLTNFLLHLSSESDDQSVTCNDREFLAEATSSDIALAQQNVLASGVNAEQLWRIWNDNRCILPDQAAKLKAELPDHHILQKVLAEHQMILCFIADLDDVSNKIRFLSSASSTTMEVRKLAHITSHLVFAKQHCEREDEIIFPELKRRGFRGILKVISEQHKQISGKHEELKELVWRIDIMDFEDFKCILTELSNFLVMAMRRHIFIEDSIVFPLALEIIPDEKTWEKMKDICDQIGYCAYHAA